MKHRDPLRLRFLVVCAALLVALASLASCTVSVASLTPTRSEGEYLSLIQEVMAESAKQADEEDSQAADRAIQAVTVWRGGEES